ncbi:unnamed protein product [Absidia cylindrospora]
MKYEQQLKSRMIPSWHLYYMAYSQLKQLLKQKSDHWLIQDEEEFENILGSELSKVCRFLRHQLDRINEQTHQLEKQLQQERQRHQQQQQCISTTAENNNGDSFVVDDGFAAQVTELVFELHDTTQFLHSNKTAFDKMVKKHDRYTSFSIQHRYNHLITASSLDTYTKQMDTLMVRLCYLYDLCRQPQQQPDIVPDHSANDNSQQQQKLHCTTFWIHPDNINEVKAICLFHLSMLPSIYPYDSNPSTTTAHPQGEKDHNNNITSVYLDNGNFDLYKKQVELCNNYNTTFLWKDAADLDDWNSNRMVRCRWYGHDTSTMHLERQQSHGTGNQQRCIIDGVSEASYLDTRHGTNTVVNTSTGSRHLDNTYHQIQHSIRQQHLEPKCRTTCQRTTFQQRGSTTLRLHIDTNITLSKISSRNSNNNKNQKHQGTGLGENKTHTFPYGLLTIDHQVAPCTANWLVELLSSHLVYPVPRFSTFVHAISLFYGDQLALSFLSPWWLLSVPKDIRKAPCNHIGLSRSASTRPLINGHRQASFKQLTAAAAAAAATTTSNQHIAIPLMHPTVYSHTNEVQHEASPGRSTWWPLRLRLRRQPQQNDHQRLKSYEDGTLLLTKELPTTSITDLSSTTIISKGKKTDTANTSKGKREVNMDAAVKNNRMTEPKTYFANERTFISWLQFCAVLLTVALSLFNHGDRTSRWMGAMFLFMTCVLACYAQGRFQYRSWQLRTRRYVLRYDDVFGPTVLCCFLVIAMMINIYLRLPLFEI